jgi:ATP-dependent Clp protease protease subunit
MQNSLIQSYRDSWNRGWPYKPPPEHQLFEERILFLSGVISDALANHIVTRLLVLDRENPEKEIQLYVNSPGGDVYHGLAIYDTMQLVRAPVSTIAVGWTASMGTVLLAAGCEKRRYALPHSTIHMHPAGGGMSGYAPEVEIRYKELKRMQDLLNNLLAKHTGQSVEKIAEDFDRDFFMDPHMAVEYGIIDEVLGEEEEEEEEEESAAEADE